MKRSTFIKRLTALSALGLPLLAISNSCSTNSTDTPQPIPGTGDCLKNGTISNIAANHGHGFVVSKADVENEAEKTYAIQGSANHNHNVTVTVAMFATLKSNSSVSATSTNASGHIHSITVTCA